MFKNTKASPLFGGNKNYWAPSVNLDHKSTPRKLSNPRNEALLAPECTNKCHYRNDRFERHGQHKRESKARTSVAKCSSRHYIVLHGQESPIVETVDQVALKL